MTKIKYSLIILTILHFLNNCYAVELKVDPNELNEFFELRDTIILLNDEMKQVIEGNTDNSFLNQGDPIQNLNGSMIFIEQRIDEFAEKQTPLRYHYIGKLRKLFEESAKLHMYAKASYLNRMEKTNKKRFEENVKLSEQNKSELKKMNSQDSWRRPYFEPIDVRLLAAVPKSKHELNIPEYEENNKTIETQINNLQKEPQNELKNNKSENTVNTEQIIPLPQENNQETPSNILVDKKIVDTKEITNTEKDEITEKLKRQALAANNISEFTDEKNISPNEEEAQVQNSGKINAVNTQRLFDKINKDIEDRAKLQAQKEIDLSSKKEQNIVISKPIELKTQIKPAVADTNDLYERNAKPTGIIKGEVKNTIRPLAIMIENHKLARPQTGLFEADLIYEIPVEGGITRFMGIFTKIPGTVGPVRSCREYFIDRALEAGAIYIHCGGSPKGYDYISSSHLYSIDEIQHGKPFFRDNSRKAPHNLYSTGRKIFDEACTLYPMLLKNIPVYIYRGSKNELSKTSKAEYVSIRYHGDYSLTIKYENGKYRRYMNDVIHIDKITEKPLEASAVILQTANMKVVDSVGRQEISFIGTGKAKIFENGKITDVTWHKETPNGITKYKDNNGNDYIFPSKGQIWIQVVSPTHKIEIK